MPLALSLPAPPAQPPRIDAVADDAAWTDATPLPGFVTSLPARGAPAADATDVRVTADARALYVLVVAHDAHPDRIHRGLGRRDTRYDDDSVAIYLDPAGDAQRAYVFTVTALGAQLDGVRTAAATADDLTWDGDWTAAARPTPDGWIAEIAIPWRSVRHPAAPTAVGLVVQRYVTHTGEQSAFPAVDPAQPGWLSEAARLSQLPTLPGAAGFELIPELAFRRGSDGPATDLWGVAGLAPGLTARYAPRPELQLLATVNPDFSEVESDEAQIDVNRRYALYYPEKRPFFLEGEEWFENPLGRVVATRSMVVPRYGARATVETDGWTVSALHTLDAAPTGTVSEGGGWTDDDVAGALAFDTIGRVRRGWSSGSYVGALYSDKTLPTLGWANRVGGLDGRVALGRADALSASALAGDTSDVGTGTAGIVGWQHGGKVVRASASETWISPGFRAENGFLPYADWLATDGNLSFDVPTHGTAVPRLRLRALQGELALDHAGAARSWEYAPELDAWTAGGVKLYGGAFLDGEQYADTLLRSARGDVGIGGPLTGWLGLYARFYAGTSPYYDPADPHTGEDERAIVEWDIQAGERVSVMLYTEAERFADTTGERYAGLVGRAEVQAFATPSFWARLIWDEDTFAGTHAAELLAAWERGPGTAVYAGAGYTFGADDPSWQALAKVSWDFRR